MDSIGMTQFTTLMVKSICFAKNDSEVFFPWKFAVFFFRFYFLDIILARSVSAPFIIFAGVYFLVHLWISNSLKLDFAIH